MIIEIETKTGSLAGTFDAPNNPTPRVGDMLASTQYGPLLQGLTTVLVVEVVYEHENGTLTPRIRCRPCSDAADSDRLRLLKDNGWLDASD